MSDKKSDGCCGSHCECEPKAKPTTKPKVASEEKCECACGDDCKCTPENHCDDENCHCGS